MTKACTYIVIKRLSGRVIEDYQKYGSGQADDLLLQRCSDPQTEDIMDRIAEGSFQPLPACAISMITLINSTQVCRLA